MFLSYGGLGQEVSIIVFTAARTNDSTAVTHYLYPPSDASAIIDSVLIAVQRPIEATPGCVAEVENALAARCAAQGVFESFCCENSTTVGGSWLDAMLLLFNILSKRGILDVCVHEPRLP